MRHSFARFGSMVQKVPPRIENKHISPFVCLPSVLMLIVLLSCRHELLVFDASSFVYKCTVYVYSVFSLSLSGIANNCCTVAFLFAVVIRPCLGDFYVT